MLAAHVRRVTREGFNLSTLPLFRAGARAAETTFGLLHPRGTYRLRVGVRVTALEGREHDTATRRCTAGKWARIAQWETGRTLGEWGVILGAAWGAILGDGTLRPSAFSGTVGYARGDSNRCRTGTGFNAMTPTVGSGCGGKGTAFPHGLPGFSGPLGYVPASGRRVPTHCPRRIAAAVQRERQREASKEYRNTRGDRK